MLVAPGASQVGALRINWQGRFQSDITNPIRVIIVDIAKPLACAKLKLTQRGAMGISSACAVVFTIDMEVVQVLISPRKEGLNDIVELSCGISVRSSSSRARTVRRAR
jgi:hypothetical protein